MSKRPLKKDEIFDSVADVADPIQRARMLDELCGSDADLRASVEDLLAQEAELGSFLELPPSAFQGLAQDAKESFRPAGKSGQEVGPPHLPEKIANGALERSFDNRQLGSEQYQKVCEWFQLVNSLDENEQKQKLNQLRAEDSFLEEFLSQMLQADALARNEDFLQQESHDSKCTQAFDDSNAELSKADLPNRIGPYQIVEKLGSGGMGVVYRAYHAQSDRFVALKLIRSAEFSSLEQIERFRREAKAAAKLQHPYIVPVFDVGTEGQIDYFTMALIEGSDLLTEIGDSSIESRRAAELISKIALALDYAHSNGIIHRDIKPGNLLINQNGEPMLMDFGLAKSSHVTESQTRTGQMLGTASYMAPEQVNDAKNVGPTTDVYGLGATLYHCLTGKAPFSGDDLLEVLQQVRQRLPVPPRSICPEIDQDLELICLRCLQKGPHDRYESAAKLAEDLHRFLKGEPIEKTPGSWWHAFTRIFRHRQELQDDLPSTLAARWVAGLTFVFHIAVFLVIATQLQNIVLWLLLAAWFAAINTVNFVYHWSQYWQLTPMERQSGIIQLAVNIAFICLFLIYGPLSVDQSSHQFLAIYPPFTLILAVALLAHGSIYLGRILLPSSLFFPLAILMAHMPNWAPLLLALGGTAIAAAVDYQLRRAKRRSD